MRTSIYDRISQINSKIQKKMEKSTVPTLEEIELILKEIRQLRIESTELGLLNAFLLLIKPLEEFIRLIRFFILNFGQVPIGISLEDMPNNKKKAIAPTANVITIPVCMILSCRIRIGLMVSCSSISASKTKTWSFA
ncbi:MAG: hypothetical protein IH859_07085, partial [Chloroflexi bacterium]|nr:hypothetical protein [Chloroflexota bacterium]